MASTKGDGTTAATQQFGSISLGESAGRKDNKNKSEQKNGTTPTQKLLCSACGKESDALMKCRACKCVWYCDKKCQNKHWKEHKKECKRIKKELDKRGGRLDLGTEKDLGPLPDLPPREECPICMRALPLHESLHAYSSCCGKTVCGGCDHQHQIKSRELSLPRTCAFCREPIPRTDEEILARLSKRVECKDPQALLCMAMHYGLGQLGLPVDQAKCIDLLRQCDELGIPGAQYQLGNWYDEGEMGLERNREEALKYWGESAEGGHLISRHNLGSAAGNNGDHVAAMRHWRLAASRGYKKSMGALITYFERGVLHHGDLAETLQSAYRARAEMKSKDRDQFIDHLKMKGENVAEYDL